MSYGKPEIPATPYNKHLPAEPAKPGRLESARDRVMDLWDKRPDMNDVYMEIAIRGALIVAVGSVAVGVTDKEFDLHLADKMSHVKVDPRRPLVVQELEQIVHGIGVEARQYEK